MTIKLSEDKYLVITKLKVQRTLFSLLSVAMAAAVGKMSIPAGRAAIRRLDSELKDIEVKPYVGVYVGDAFEDIPVTVPKNANAEYIWELRDDGVLAVSNGRIIARQQGTTTLGVNAGDIYKEIEVSVQYKPLPAGSTLPPIYYETLPIANYRSQLTADDVPEDLIQIPAEYVAENYYTLYVCRETFEKYKELLNAMRADIPECRMHIISAYRSYAKQTELYDKAVRNYIAQGKTSVEARVLALNTTQTPGNSEHQLGNTIDVSNDYNTDHHFEETPEGMWLAANAHKYGFIIRYPADKEDITRIEYEPWHIRYVGIYHAAYMYVNNVCLEEYVELQEKAAQTAEDYAETHPATYYG